MGRMGRKRQQGFSVVEMIITVCILAILSSVAIAQMRDYSRRARISEVMLALGGCKNMIGESYTILDSAPPAGGWGCEGSGVSYYAGAVQTSADGVVRVPINNLDRVVDGRYIYLVPAKSDGATAMTTPDDLGRSVKNWICGSDWLPVRNALPSGCRFDTTTYSTHEFR